MSLGRLQDVQGALDVHGTVTRGILDRDGDAGLGAQVVDLVRLDAVEKQVDAGGVHDVQHLEGGRRVDSTVVPGGEIVDHDDRHTVIDQRVNYV